VNTIVLPCDIFPGFVHQGLRTSSGSLAMFAIMGVNEKAPGDGLGDRRQGPCSVCVCGTELPKLAPETLVIG
jgi:hypothetical protein